MTQELKQTIERLVAPRLTQIGFTGSFPDWRRVHSEGIDVISFEVDHDGGARVGVEYGFTSPFRDVRLGELTVTPQNLTTASLRFSARRRLNPAIRALEAPVPDYWYTYADGNLERCASRILNDLCIAESWWTMERENERLEKTPPAFFKMVDRA